MRRTVAPLVLLGIAVLPRIALADDGVTEGGAYGFFIAGTSEGEPSTAKQVTAFTLYGASALSLGASAYFFVGWSDATQRRDDFSRTQPDACSDLGSFECRRASELDSDLNRSFALGFGGLAASVTLAVSGVFVAEYWPNLTLTPGFAVLPNGGFASTTLRF